MKTLKKTAALVMAFAMLLSLTSCGKVKEYDVDGITSVLEDKLGIEEDHIYISEIEGSGDIPGGTSISAQYEDARINVLIADDADKLKDLFEGYYDDLTGTLDDGDFDGSYKNALTDNFGYVVVKGEQAGSTLGSRFATGSIYAGLYYTGSMFVMIIPESLGDSDDGMTDNVGVVIDAFGFPNV